MKTISIYYILSTLVYFAVGTGSWYWACFNMLSVLLTVCVSMYYVYYNIRVNADTKSWISFGVIMTICRMIYTTACPHAPVEWIYLMNKIFAGIITLCLIAKTLLKLSKN